MFIMFCCNVYVILHPVARRLRSAGTLYQLDLENMWDLVQKLLLDADVEVCTAQHSTVAQQHDASTAATCAALRGTRATVCICSCFASPLCALRARIA
jgi:hypothetical protein